MNDKAQWQTETGQALIQATLSLLVLIGFVALAIDVGRVYSERRNMQNAADAAALAGARELCLNRSQAAAETKAAEVMRANGVAASAISADDITFPTSFSIKTVARYPDLSPIVGQLVAWDVVDVSAMAKAACGAPTSACGIWPIALSGQTWKEIQPPAGECDERKIAIWHDDLKSDEEYDSKTPYCEIDGKPRADICDCYDCPDDLVLLSTGGRGWLDFSSFIDEDASSPFKDACYDGSGGTSALKCQIRRNSAVKIGQLPACVDGLPGVRASTEVPIDERKGQIVKVPLYDSVECALDATNPNKKSYLISSFACVSVVGWMQLKDKDAYDLKKDIPIKDEFQDEPWAAQRQDIKKSEKVIVIQMACNGCMTACGSTDGTDPGASGLRAVSLIE